MSVCLFVLVLSCCVQEGQETGDAKVPPSLSSAFSWDVAIDSSLERCQCNMCNFDWQSLAAASLFFLPRSSQVAIPLGLCSLDLWPRSSLGSVARGPFWTGFWGLLVGCKPSEGFTAAGCLWLPPDAGECRASLAHLEVIASCLPLLRHSFSEMCFGHPLRGSVLFSVIVGCTCSLQALHTCLLVLDLIPTP